MQCKDVARAIEQDGIAPLPRRVLHHASGCAACSSLIADMQLIVDLASELPAEVEPPARVWTALRAQLRSEDIIQEPGNAGVSSRAPWWESLAYLLRGRVLATVALALLVVTVGIYFEARRTTAVDHLPGTPVIVEPFAAAASSLDQEEQSLGAMQTASATDSSPVDASLRENLATLNAFIKECRKRLQEDPNDQVARDYLAAAYQQKSEILAALMERGRSVN